VIGALGSLVIAAPVVYYLGKEGVIVQLALSALTLVFISSAVARRVFDRWQVSAKVADFGRREAGMLLKFGMFSLTTTLVIPAVMLLTQTYVIKTAGVSENGLFQAAWTLFWLYVGFATASFSTYIFPTMSAAKSVGDLTRQVDNSLRFLIMMTTPVSCAIIIFPTQILGILYTSEFSGAATLLQILAIATCFRVLSLPMAFAYVAKGHLKEYLLFEVSWHAVFIGIVVATLAQTGIVVIGVATLTAYAVYSALAMAFGRRTLSVRYSSRNMMAFALSLTVLVVTLAAYLMVDNLAIPIGIAGIATWFMATTRREERQWLKSHVPRLGKGKRTS
jgi:O-antigen/teichoic acid export membrane protein